MSTITWGGNSADWADDDDWQGGTAPGAADTAAISVSGFYSVSLTTSITVAAITISDNDATLSVSDTGGVDSVTGALDDAGDIYIDNGGSGGSTLAIGGVLTDSNYVQVGGGGASGAVDAQDLANTGRIVLYGGSTFDVTGSAAPGTWTGTVDIDDSGLLEYAGSSQITSIGSGAQLNINTSTGYLADAGLGLGGNTALGSLDDNAGQLSLQNGASITTTGPLNNTGYIYVGTGGSNGSTLTVDGVLTNGGYVQVGGGGASGTISAQGLANTGNVTLYDSGVLDVTGQAAATWTGTVNINDRGLLEFAGAGQITSIGSGAQININTSTGYLADAGLGLGGNTALGSLDDNAGQLSLQNGASITTTGPLNNTGYIYVGTGGSNGSTLTVDGVLTNGGYVQVGGGGASGTISAQGLANTGNVTLYDSGVLDVTGQAAATGTGTVNINDSGLLEFAGAGQITSIGSGAQININTSTGYLADAGLGLGGNTALGSLDDNAGQLSLQNGALLTTTGPLNNTGYIYVGTGGSNGSALTVEGVLTNGGYIQVGGGGASGTISAQGLANTGNVTLYDSGVLDVTAQAAATWTGIVNINDSGLLEFAGAGQITSIGSGAQININTSTGYLVDAGLALGGNTALGGLADNAGQLSLTDGATLTTTQVLDDTGNIYVDNGGSGGSTLNVGGVLTVDNYVQIGGFNASGTINTQGLVDNGTIIIYNSSTLDVTAQVAPSTWTGRLDINEDGGLLEYSGSSQITAIASGSQINLNASSGYIADAGLGLTGNTALGGLADNAGQLSLTDGATVTTTQVLDDTGNIYVDNGGSGGSTLNVGGVLTVGGYVQIGGFSASGTINTQGLADNGTIIIYNASTLDVTGQVAPSTWTGRVDINENGGLLEYSGSSQITAIASGAQINLNASSGYVADAGLGLAGNTALGGLADNAGQLSLTDGATVTTTQELDNTGNIYVDNGGSGGSTLNVGGVLTVGGYVQIGGFSASGTINTQGLADNGTIIIYNASTLDVTGQVAPSTWTGRVDINENGGLLEYSGSSQITAIASGAQINLNAASSYLADAGLGLTGNTALGGLADNAGQLSLTDGATVTTTQELDNTGNIYVDNGGSGASALNVGGVLTVGGYVQIGGFSASGTIDAQGLADNGTIIIYNSSTLDVTAQVAPSTWTGRVDINQDGGLLEYSGSNQITAIATGAQINLNAASGYLADAGLGLTGNTALEGLADNAGQLSLSGGGSITTTQGLNDTGNLYIDNGGPGGSTLNVGGVLTVDNYVQIGGFSASGTMDVKGLTNKGTINLYNTSALDVDGDATTSGTINDGGSIVVTAGHAFTVAGGTTTITGALEVATVDVNGGTLDFTNALTAASGTGDFDLGGTGVLEIGGAVDGGHTVDFTSTSGVLELAAPGAFAPTIENFSEGDKIDLLNTAVTGLSYANGVLTVSDGATTVATLNLQGAYTSADFIDPTDNNGGTDIELAQNAAQATIEQTGGSGTLTRNGNNYTLSFGTVADGSGPLTADLEVLNSAVAPADTLSGSFTVSGNAAFSNTGLGAFSNIAAGGADTAPSITFTPGAPGTFDETITLAASSVNGGGATSIPAETLTITGQVAAPAAPPVITTSGLLVVGNDIESPIDGISVAPGAGQAADTQITLTLSEPTGGLAFYHANGADAASTEQASSITLTGTADFLNQMLSELVYTGGASTLTITATEEGESATETLPIALPATNNPDQPYADPVDVLLENSADVIGAVGGQATGATAALLQWDQGGTAYVGKVYVNLPLTSGDPAQVGFEGLMDGADVRLAGSMGADGKQEPNSPTVGDWSVALQDISTLMGNDPESFGTVTDSNAGQDDTITLTFPSSLDSGTPELPDRRVVIVFNKPGPTEVDEDGGDDDGGGDDGDDNGDIHLRTYDNLYYNFQATGEFTLARSTTPGDAFDVQIRSQPWSNSASVSVTTEAAIALGGDDRVTFDVNRTGAVWIDGSAAGAAGLTPGGAPITFGAATLRQLTSTSWEVVYATGESVTVTNYRSFLDVNTSLPRSATPGAYQGLLGNANGNAADDFTLPDGTILSQPLSYSDLYTTWANAWRVTQSDSMLDYGAGQSTATFTDVNFPDDSLNLSDLPTSVQQNALAAAAAAGITDPTVAQAAALDYALTGDPAFLSADQQGSTQVTAAPDPTPPSAPQAVGVDAVSPQVTQAASGPTDVEFEVYRTGADLSSPVTVNYAVQAPTSGYLGASYFADDALPSGSVTIAAGAQSATFTLAVTGSLDDSPSGQLQVGIDTGTGGLPVVGATASTTLVNANAVPGVAAQPAFVNPFDVGTLTQSGDDWTLALGAISVDNTSPIVAIDVANLASAPADTLFGKLQQSGTGVTFQNGLPPIVGLDPGQTLELDATLDASSPGQIDETVTFDANERNSSGYSAALTPITLTITADVEPAAVATINTASPIVFGKVHQGAAANEALSVTNSASAGATGLDAFFSSVPAGLIATGDITQLAPQATDTTDLVVGLDTSSAGAKSGTVTVNFAADSGGGKTSPLPSQIVQASGAVYRLADPVITPLSTIVHVNDPGTAILSVANDAAADGYSENLVATLASSTGAVSVAGGPTGEIAPQASDNSDFTETFSTAQAAVLSGSATFNLTSDGGTGAGSIDGLGQTVLAAQTAPISVTVDNYANPTLEETSGGGTLTRSGNNFTLDLGAIAENSGPLNLGLGVLNDVTGPSDLLSGSLQASGSAAFSATGLDPFSGIGAGQTDTAPTVTLQTTESGEQTETITLTPTGSNASGYSGALPTETLTIEANVQSLPPPTITAPQSQTVFANMAAVLGPISIADTNGEGPVTVVVSDADGSLSTNTIGTATVDGGGSNKVTLTGDLADVNAELAALTYTTTDTSGDDTVDVTVTDGAHASATESIPIAIQNVPFTEPVLDAPFGTVLIPGQSSGIAGISVSDPYAEANGQQLTLKLSASGLSGPITVSGGPGGTVTGNGTDLVTVTGTVDQINSYLSDGVTENILADAYQKAEADAKKAGEEYGDLNSLLSFVTTSATEGLLAAGTEYLKDQADDAIQGALGIDQPDIGKTLVEVDVGLFSFAANVLNDVAAFAAGATTFPPPAGSGGGPGIHIVTYDGLIYLLDGAGDYLLTGSTASSDTYTVEIRLTPLNGSSSASEITQVGAQVGTDKVTIGVGRSSVVMVNGSAVSLTTDTPDKLSGGEVEQLSANTYQVTWNTGEILTVTSYGTYLDVRTGLGSNNAAGSLIGLMGANDGQADDFTLPDGTVATVTSAADLQSFADAYLLPQANTLLDGTDTIDTSFPTAALTLDDFPSAAIAKAAAAVAAAGITDPGAAAATELDYILSGGDPSVIASDQTLYQGVTTTEAKITPPPPVATLGVIADTPEVNVNESGETALTFDVYLTAAEADDATVDYSVIAPNADDLGTAAFGGAFPSGAVTIAAGETSGQFTVEVPEGALAALPSANVAVEISSSTGAPIYAPTASEKLTTPQPGSAPVPTLTYLTSYGTFVNDGDGSYTLDLGPVQYGQPLPTLQFGVANDAAAPSDQLSGTFTVAPVEGFSVTGAELASALAAGQSYNGIDATINTVKFGDNGETITFNPIDTNSTGFSAPLSPLTLTITDTLELPTITYSQAWGDVHIVTYNGLTYNFQGVGDYTLAQARVPGDTFDIEMDLEPWYAGASVTTIHQVAITLGDDSATFDWNRTGAGFDDALWVDHSPTAIAIGQTLTLGGGTITEVSPDVFKVNWNTGEIMTVTNAGSYINIIDGIPPGDVAGGVAGLQGEAEGADNDFQLNDGTVLPQPLSDDTLYGEYAQSWEAPATNFDGPQPAYGGPPDPLSLADLPSAVVAQAASMAAAAGITNPAFAQEAELDYIATGDPSFLTSAAAAQQQASSVATSVNQVTTSTPPAPSIGVMADAASVTEVSGQGTVVTFTAYLTSDQSTPTDVHYTVVSGGTGFLDASDFGGTLPSGDVTIAPNTGSATFQITLPADALGNLPSGNLQVQVSSGANNATPLAVFAPTAQTEIINNQPTEGNPAIPVLTELSGGGTLTFDAATDTYTLDLGDLIQGSPQPAAVIALDNTATPVGDLLDGSFTAPIGSGFGVVGASLSKPIAAGGSYTGLEFTPDTGVLGSNTMSLSFNPTDVNDSGFSQSLGGAIKLNVVDTIGATAAETINTPSTILFPNVHVGASESQAVSFTNSAAAPAASLDVTPYANDDATATGSISMLAAGATETKDLSVGLNTSAAGQQSGAVALVADSDFGGGATTPILPIQTINVFGSVYRLADPSVSPSVVTVHVGDSGAQLLTITNIDPNDNFSENLIATVVGTTGAVTASGTTGDIAPQSDATLGVNFSTSTPGQIGSVTLDLKSDGTGIDGLGMTDLGDVTIPVVVTGDDVPAAAAFEEISGGGTFTQQGAAYTLNLGAITSPTTVSLGVLNSAAAPADALSGSFQISNASDEFVNSGFAAFSGVAAAQADTAPTVTFGASGVGTFSETITLNPTDAVTGATLPVETLTITGTVGATPPTLTAPSTLALDAGVAGAVAGVSVDDSNVGVSVTVQLSDTAGLLSASTNGAGGGGTITGAGATNLTVTGTVAQVNADLATLTDTEIAAGSDTIQISAGDSLGGKATPASIAVTTVTKTVSIDPVDGDNVINNAEAHAAGGVALSGTVNGAAPNSTFTVSVVDGSFSKTYTATVNTAGTGWTATIPETDAITLPNGAGTVTATLSSSVTASETVTVAETLPTVTFSPVEGNNVITGADANAPGGVPLSGSVSGLAAGATFSVSVVQTDPFSKTYTATVDSAGTGWTATIPESDAVTLSDGTATLSTQVTDAFGNVSAPATDTVTVSETPPTVTIAAVDGDNVITNAEAHAAAGVALSGTVSGLAAGATFTVTVTDGGFDKTYTATVNAAGNGWTATLPEADAITLAEGTGTVTAQVTNAFGVSSTIASDNFTVSIALPLAPVITAPANGSQTSNVDPPITGTGAAGDTVTVSIDGSVAGTTTVAANDSWTFTPRTPLATGKHSVIATQTDAFGNVSLDSATDTFAIAKSGTGTGDVHMLTYDGLHYDFQADGSYVLTQSTVPGDDFEIQIQTAPYAANNATSLITAVAAQLGSDIVAFDAAAANPLIVDGVADTALNSPGQVQTFAAGELVELSSTNFQVNWNTGETLFVDDAGVFFNTSVTLGPSDGPGSVQGLLGPDTGQANDIELPNGTVLSSTNTRQLLGEYAQAWSVAPDDSLFGSITPPQGRLDIISGQTVSLGDASSYAVTFTNTGGNASLLILTAAQDFTGSIAGMDFNDSIDLFNFNLSHSSITAVNGTGARGTYTDVTITDANPADAHPLSVTLQLLNQYANQFGVHPYDYFLGPDHMSNGGALFQLAAR